MQDLLKCAGLLDGVWALLPLLLMYGSGNWLQRDNAGEGRLEDLGGGVRRGACRGA